MRRGLVCNLEALDERPELREFQRDALERAAANRGAYVAAALTIIRAYLAAGTPPCLRAARQLCRLVDDGAQPARLAGGAGPGHEHGFDPRGGSGAFQHPRVL